MSETREMQKAATSLEDLVRPIAKFPCPQCEGEDGACSCWNKL